MTQLTLDIKDNQINFFLELISRFDFVKIRSKSDLAELTQEQINSLDERLENYKNNPDSYLDLEDVKKNIKADMKYNFKVSPEADKDIHEVEIIISDMVSFIQGKEQKKTYMRILTCDSIFNKTAFY